MGNAGLTLYGPDDDAKLVARNGPDDDAKLVARDDDSGAGWNAKIVKDLTPSIYYVRVEHYDSQSGTGAYSIKVMV